MLTRFVADVHRMARTLARRLPSSVSVDDLAAAGLLAFVEERGRSAAANDEEDEAPSAIWARVRWAMLDELRRNDPVSRRVRMRLRALDRARRALEQRLGRSATMAEVIATSGLGDVVANDALGVEAQFAPPPRARDTSTSTEVEPEPLELASDALDPSDLAGAPNDPERLTLRRERQRLVLAAIDALPDRLRLVVELYYFDERPLREIGRHLGVSEVRASQLLRDALTRVRARCADDEGAARSERASGSERPGLRLAS
jgi:RNA polymerase sigma factor for flagellar operon FliA